MMASMNIYKANLKEQAEIFLTNYINNYPDRVRVNSQLQLFKSVKEIGIKIESEYADKVVLAGGEIKLKISGDIVFEGKTDISSNFSLSFKLSSIFATYDVDKESFKIYGPGGIIFF